ncbi:hypothetical protein DFH27DRAFT_340001 [Peziza echinospora]|nr:hypothetical protein DFH27DRAFT_340001 [Peziza echinospora]
MNLFTCIRSPRVTASATGTTSLPSLLSPFRNRPFSSSRLAIRQSRFLPPTRRPTTTSTRKSSSFNIPPNGIIVPGPPPPALYQRATYALSPVLRIFHAYGRAQNKRPYTTQLATSIAIYLLGDINAQLLFGDKDAGYDGVRTLRMVTIGSILSAPSYCWYLYLSGLFQPRFSKPVAVALRVLINQLCFTPVFLTAFFSLQSFFTGATKEETAERLQQTLPAAYKNSCQLWPAVTAMNFYWVKMEYRSVVSGVIAIGWNAYLSYLNQRAGLEDGLEDVVPVMIEPEQMKPLAVSFTGIADIWKSGVSFLGFGQDEASKEVAAA